MGKAHPKRATAKLRLVERHDGVVQIEILTSRRLESFHRWTWTGWDPTRQEHMWEDDGIHMPDEYLQEPHLFQLTVSGPERGKWRYIDARVGAPVDGFMQKLAGRQLDLSEGSEERRLLGLLAQQEEIPLVWVNEGIEVAFPSALAAGAAPARLQAAQRIAAFRARPFLRPALGAHPTRARSRACRCPTPSWPPLSAWIAGRLLGERRARAGRRDRRRRAGVSFPEDGHLAASLAF